MNELKIELTPLEQKICLIAAKMWLPAADTNKDLEDAQKSLREKLEEKSKRIYLQCDKTDCWFNNTIKELINELNSAKRLLIEQCSNKGVCNTDYCDKCIARQLKSEDNKKLLEAMELIDGAKPVVEISGVPKQWIDDWLKKAKKILGD